MMDIPPIDRQIRRNVGDAAEKTDFGTVHWAVRAGDPPGAEQTIGLATFDAGKSNVEHIHPNCEEVVFVLEGEVRHALGGEETVLRAGDLILVPRNAPHRVINDGDMPARTFIVFSSPDRQFVPVSDE
jgi:quercetin dioxygenase-like cupin family protein